MAGETLSQNDHGNVDLLCFSVSPYRFCLPAVEVVSILPPQRLTRLPFSAADVAGIFPHAGEVVTCYDLRKKFSLPPRGETEQPGQWLLGRDDGALLAFWVDKVSDIVERQNLERQPLSMPTAGMTPFSGCYLDGEQIVLETTIERLHRCAAAAFHVAGLAPVQRLRAAAAGAPGSAPPPQAAARAEPTREPPPTDDRAGGSVSGDSAALPAAENPIADTSAVPPSVDEAMMAGGPVTGVGPDSGPETVGVEDGQRPPGTPAVNSAAADAGVAAANSAAADLTATRSGSRAAATDQQQLFARHQGEVQGSRRDVPPVTDRLSGHDPGNADVLDSKHTSGTDAVAGPPSNNAALGPAAARAEDRYGNEGGREPAGSERHEVAPGAPMSLVAEDPLVPSHDRRDERDGRSAPRRLVGGWVWGVVAMLVLLTVAYPVFVSRGPAPPAAADRVVDDVGTRAIVRGAGGRDADTAVAVDAAPAAASVAPSPVSGLQEVLRIEDNDLLIRVERQRSPAPLPATATVADDVAVGAAGAPATSVEQTRGNDLGGPAPQERVTSGTASTTAMATDDTTRRDIVRPGEFIRHRVVRGDTLWHIARHYLGDPFRYPQLARLSHIDNPDLIYPGDLVTIERRASAE